MVPNGPKWSQIVQNGPKLSNMVPNGLQWSQTTPNYLKLPHTRPNFKFLEQLVLTRPFAVGLTSFWACFILQLTDSLVYTVQFSVFGERTCLLDADASASPPSWMGLF